MCKTYDDNLSTVFVMSRVHVPVQSKQIEFSHVVECSFFGNRFPLKCIYGLSHRQVNNMKEVTKNINSLRTQREQLDSVYLYLESIASAIKRSSVIYAYKHVFAN